MNDDPRWEGSPPFDPEPQVYILAGGHGCEDIGYDLSERQKVPDGYKLITASQCGALTLFDERAIATLRQFQPPREFADSPYRKERFLKMDKWEMKAMSTILDTPLRIYQPGDLMPSLHFQPFADYEGQVGISGVLKYPISNEVDIRKQVPFSDSEDILDEIYSGSVYPTVGAARKIFNNVGKSYDLMKKELKIDVLSIMKRLGPGTYFFIVCRAPNECFPLQSEVLSRLKTDPVKFTKYLKNIPAHAFNLANEIGPETNANRGVLTRIMLTRALSNAQQERNNNTGEGLGAGAGAGAGARGKSKRPDPFARAPVTMEEAEGGAGAGAGAGAPKKVIRRDPFSRDPEEGGEANGKSSAVGGKRTRNAKCRTKRGRRLTRKKNNRK
jgi:hypothetical protein